MTRFYFLLSLAGWVWLLVLGGYLIWARRRSAGEGQPASTDRTKTDA